MAVDPSEAVDTPVDDLADLEIDEDLVHVGSDDDGGSEEETAVQAAPPAPAPAAAANQGRGTSAKGAGVSGKGRGGKARPAAAAAGQKYGSVGRRRQAYLRAARRVRGQGGVGAGEEGMYVSCCLVGWQAAEARVSWVRGDE